MPRMKYVSTRGQTDPLAFKDAVIAGLAPDGGLLIPSEYPDVCDRLDEWSSLDFIDLALAIFSTYVDDIDRDEMRRIATDAFACFETDEVAPTVTVGDHRILELFHGPTLAFKDVALTILGRLFESILSQRGTRLNVLGATSGDTGSAAISGVRGRSNIAIFVLFPAGRTSPLQELQMTTIPDENVHCLAIDGSFDDCQSIVKQSFANLDLKSAYSLGAVNSVNWARLMAQITYYFYSHFRSGESESTFVVPTGNFGNIFAGFVAREMGLPIERLVLATNENDILARFFATGRYTRGDVHFTLSPSMDIQVASNFERFIRLRLGDPKAVREFMGAFAATGTACIDDGRAICDYVSPVRVDTRETLATIADLYKSDGYIVDPHTAVGIAGARRLGMDGAICMATAHPAKFPDAVSKAIGVRPTHPRLDGLEDLPIRRTSLPASLDAVQGYLREHAVA